MIPEKSEPRCHVCRSEYRKAIDRLVIMPNVSYTELAEMFKIDRRSISRHAKDHLNYEEAAIKRIIEKEAEALSEDAEEGVSGALNRRVFLSAYIQRATESLLNGEMELTGKEAMNAIVIQDKIDNTAGGAELDEIRMQFNAFVQAIREITQYDIDRIGTPQDLQALILGRMKNLLGRIEEMEQKQLPG